MSPLFDLGGTPILLESVTSFRLVKRECLYYPAYHEVELPGFSLLPRLISDRRKRFMFSQMFPYGILISDKEQPVSGSHEIKAFGTSRTPKPVSRISRSIGDLITLAADKLHIDTSVNKAFRILTPSRQVVETKLRDIPARVAFLSGKVSDVYKDDPYYTALGEPISPTIVTVSTLVVTIDKTTHVFFGGGIDLADAEATYHSLFEAYNQHQADKSKKKSVVRFPAFNLPKLDLTAIPLQLPFGKGKDNEVESEATAMLPTAGNLSANNEAAHALDANDQQAT